MLHAMNIVGGLICVGSSLAITFGLISKLVQVIRFINVGYSPQLAGILLTWGTDILNLNIPTKIDQRIVSKDIPWVYTKYGVEASFLSNFWGKMMILSVILGLWIICRVFIYCVQSYTNRCANLICAVLKKSSKSIFNLLVLSVYEGLSDVAFFFVLEMKSLSLVSVASDFSFAFSVFFMLLGLFLLILHWRFLLKYRTLKSQATRESSQALRLHIKRNHRVRVLYEDFSDENLFKHAFLFVLTARDVVISLIVTTMLNSPLAESMILISCSIVIGGYLVFRNPFRDRLDQVSQIFLELCLFTVSSCVVIFAILDQRGEPAESSRHRLGMAIIIVNVLINIGGVIIILLRIVQEIWSAYKNHFGKENHTRRGIVSRLDLNNNISHPVRIRFNRDNPVENNSMLQEKTPERVINRRRIGGLHKSRNKNENEPQLFEDSSSSIQAPIINNDRNIIAEANSSRMHKKNKKVMTEGLVPGQLFSCNLASEDRIPPMNALAPVERATTTYAPRAAERKRPLIKIPNANDNVGKMRRRKQHSSDHRQIDPKTLKPGDPLVVQYYRDQVKKDADQAARASRYQQGRSSPSKQYN